MCIVHNVHYHSVAVNLNWVMRWDGYDHGGVNDLNIALLANVVGRCLILICLNVVF